MLNENSTFVDLFQKRQAEIDFQSAEDKVKAISTKCDQLKVSMMVAIRFVTGTGNPGRR